MSEEIPKEIMELIPKIDISTTGKLAQFKKWQEKDGTIEGLRGIYRAQQREAELWAINDELIKAGFEPWRYESFAACIAELRKRAEQNTSPAAAIEKPSLSAEIMKIIALYQNNMHPRIKEALLAAIDYCK